MMHMSTIQAKASHVEWDSDLLVLLLLLFEKLHKFTYRSSSRLYYYD